MKPDFEERAKEIAQAAFGNDPVARGVLSAVVQLFGREMYEAGQCAPVRLGCLHSENGVHEIIVCDEDGDPADVTVHADGVMDRIREACIKAERERDEWKRKAITEGEIRLKKQTERDAAIAKVERVMAWARL